MTSQEQLERLRARFGKDTKSYLRWTYKWAIARENWERAFFGKRHSVRRAKKWESAMARYHFQITRIVDRNLKS